MVGNRKHNTLLIVAVTVLVLAGCFFLRSNIRAAFALSIGALLSNISSLTSRLNWKVWTFILLNRWRNAVNKSLELSGGSAQDKYEIISEITVQAGEFREKFISKSDKLQSDINVVNLIILFLPVLLMSLMIYVGFFSKYGGK